MIPPPSDPIERLPDPETSISEEPERLRLEDADRHADVQAALRGVRAAAAERRVRSLPHSDEAERGVIGGVVLDNNQWQKVSSIVGPADFHQRGNAIVFRTVAGLMADGVAVDLITLRDRLTDRGEIENAGGVGYLASLLDGTARSANVEHYAKIVREKASRRRIIAMTEHLQKTAWNGSTSDELDRDVRDARLILEDAAPGTNEGQAAVIASTLEDVVNPSAGEVRYLIDKLLPAEAFTLQGAGFKTGKTLVWYSAALDVARGARVFSHFVVAAPIKVAVFQFEMPDREDNRRFRRLAIGAGMYPAEVVDLVRSGYLTVFNRPSLNLAVPRDLARFHETIRRAEAQFVLVDSCIAAFAGQDINDNGTVRQLVADAFGPLTSEGRAVLGLHHKRKKISGARADEDDRHAIIGAQAWQASADRVYALERLDFAPVAHDDAKKNHAFRLRLSPVGSWTPEDSEDVVLEVRDVTSPEHGEGTSVLALAERAQLQTGGVSPKQRAALALAKLVGVRGVIAQKAAFAVVGEEENVKERTLASALDYAKAKRWIAQRKIEGSKKNEQELIPGDAEGETE